MKKRIVILIVFILLTSLVFASCGGNDDNRPADESGMVVNTETSQKQETNTPEGFYSYDIDGITLTLRTNVDKYIRNGIFYYEELAHDFGWHAPRPEQETNNNQMIYWYGEDDNHLAVSFTDIHELKPEMVFFEGIGTYSEHVIFARYDDGSYTIHEGGRYYANYEQIVIIAYIMEECQKDMNCSPINSLYTGEGVWKVNK